MKLSILSELVVGVLVLEDITTLLAQHQTEVQLGQGLRLAKFLESVQGPTIKCHLKGLDSNYKTQ